MRQKSGLTDIIAEPDQDRWHDAQCDDAARHVAFNHLARVFEHAIEQGMTDLGASFFQGKVVFAWAVARFNKSLAIDREEAVESGVFGRSMLSIAKKCQNEDKANMAHDK
jgi:hypothetical protein